MSNTQERRERILRLLTLRKKWTMRELAQELGVTERTVMRDVNTLSLSKPIGVDTGRRGGVFLMDYRYARPCMTQRETAALRHAIAFLDAGTNEFRRVGNVAPLTSAELQTLREIAAYYGKN